MENLIAGLIFGAAIAGFVCWQVAYVHGRRDMRREMKEAETEDDAD